MFNEPSIVTIRGLPNNYEKADVIKLLMRVGRVYFKVLSLRKTKFSKFADILIWNGSAVNKIKNHFCGFKLGECKLSTSSRPFPVRTGRLLYELDATAKQKRYYNLGHQILNETKSYHPNFCNIDYKCQHKLSSGILAACVEEMTKIEATEGRVLTNHELTEIYRVWHPVNQDADKFATMIKSLSTSQKVIAKDFFWKPKELSHTLSTADSSVKMNEAINRKINQMRGNLHNYLQYEMSKKRPPTEITMAHDQVLQQVSLLQTELMLHVKDMLKEKTLPSANKVYTKYLKIYGEPELPTPENMNAFLAEYGPSGIFHHHEMYNLIIVSIVNKINLLKLLKANGKMIDGCRLHISPAGATLVEHVERDYVGSSNTWVQKKVEPVVCSDVIVITDDANDTNVPVSEVQSQMKEGNEKGKRLGETNFEEAKKMKKDVGADSVIKSSVEKEGVTECKVDREEGGPVDTKMIEVFGDKDQLTVESNDESGKCEMKEKLGNATSETMEDRRRIDNDKSDEEQSKLTKKGTAEEKDAGKCADTNRAETELDDDNGSDNTEFDCLEDYKIIDEVFEDFSFDTIGDNDE